MISKKFLNEKNLEKKQAIKFNLELEKNIYIFFKLISILPNPLYGGISIEILLERFLGLLQPNKNVLHPPRITSKWISAPS